MKPWAEAPRVGIVLHADLEYLEQTRSLVDEECQLLEVTPETLWRVRDGELGSNDYRPRVLETRARLGIPIVAHGTLFSLGTDLGDEPDGSPVAARTRAWVQQLARDQAELRFAWITEHMGFSAKGPRHVMLPLPLPWTAAAVAATRARLALLASTGAPLVGFENTAQYFTLDPWQGAPDFFRAVCGEEHALLLDLHNVHVECTNADLDPLAWLARVDLGQVIEVHLAGGTTSPAGWLASGRELLLDSHEAPVPEAVWSLFEHVLARCPRLRGVVIERMPGTLGADGVRGLRDEVRRARALVAAAHAAGPGPSLPPPSLLPERASLAQLQAALVEAVCAPSPWSALDAARASDPALAIALAGVERNGFELAALLVRKLRLERLLQGSREAAWWMQERPEELVRTFRRYHESVAPVAVFPPDEARTFEAWIAGD